MKDQYGRTIQYLRLSLTDLCNLRCIYCMEPDGVAKKHHSDILSIEELAEIAQAAYALGIRKIRLTGGEPLIRKGILTLCRKISETSDDIELSITTNGTLLPVMAKELKAAGVDRLNISLDSTVPETFKRITRVGELQQTLDGIRAALDCGFDNIKINTVLLGGINEDEIPSFIRWTKDTPIAVRFIELMPLGVAGNWEKHRFINVSAVEPYLQDAVLLHTDGVARDYQIPGYKGTIGLISPMSHSFCDICNKIRVTADGKLKPCLHSKDEIDLKGLHGEELIEAMRTGILQKPLQHELKVGKTATPRNMNEIGG